MKKTLQFRTALLLAFIGLVYIPGVILFRWPGGLWAWLLFAPLFIGVASASLNGAAQEHDSKIKP